MAAHGRADDDKEDDLAALRIVFPQLVEELQADDVIDDLYQRNLLTKNEYEEFVDASSKEESKTTNRRILMAVTSLSQIDSALPLKSWLNQNELKFLSEYFS